MKRNRMIPIILILFCLIPIKSAGQSISNQPVLRELAHEEALIYVRIPNIWGFLCSPKKGVLSKIQGHQTHLDFIRNAKKSFGDEAGGSDIKKDPLFTFFLSKLESPLEMIVFQDKVSKTPIPNFFLCGMLNIETIEDFGKLLGEIAGRYPQLRLLGPINPLGEAMLMIQGFPAFVKYDVPAHRFNLVVGMGAGKELLDQTLSQLKPAQDHPMHQLENEIDTSRQGLFIWLNTRKILSPTGPLMQLQDPELMKKWGLSDIRSIALGWGTFQEKGALKLIVDWPASGYRKLVPEFHNVHDLTARGTLQTVMTLNLPLYEILNFIKDFFKAENNLPALEDLLQLEENFLKELGIPIESVLKAIGPEIIFFDDEVGKFLAIRIKDRQQRDGLLDVLIKKLKFTHETYTRGEAVYHHLMIPENSLLNKLDHAPIKSVYLNRIKWHLYWTEDSEYMIFSGIPQPLFDRQQNTQKTSIYEWLQKDKKQDIQNSVFSLSTNIPDSPRLIYYVYLKALSVLSDLTEVKLNLFNLPSAHEIDLPIDGFYGINLDISEDRIALNFAFENNPLEILLNGTALPVAGVLAAIAIPNFISYQQKAREAVVKTTLSNLASQEQMFYSKSSTYTSDLNKLGVSLPPGVEVKIIMADNNCFLIQATKMDTKNIWTIDCKRNLKKMPKQ
ncbi:type IV pilin protein [Thermodesulfobacteriota bacterium]